MLPQDLFLQYLLLHALCFTQNGLDLIPGIGDAGDRLYLGATAAEIAPPPDTSSEPRSDQDKSVKKLKSSTP